MNAVQFIVDWIADARAEIASATQPTRPKRQIKYPGLCADARRLRCSRIHLYLVLSGRRESRRLLRRYQQLKEAA